MAKPIAAETAPIGPTRLEDYSPEEKAQYYAVKAKLSAFIASRKSLPGLDWAEKLKARHMAGEKLLTCQMVGLDRALGKGWDKQLIDEDAREARLEREAIQSEGA